MKILVIFGGKSSEYGISLISASYVIQALNELKIECICIGITEKNQWYLTENNPEQIRSNHWKNEHSLPVHLNCTSKTLSTNKKELTFDAVLPICHGAFGEDGKLQGLLECMEFNLIGCGSLSSALCMDKLISHQLAEAAGIPCAKSVLIESSFTPEQIGFPMIIKPVCSGSSYGISVVKKKEDLSAAIQNALQYDKRVLAEQFVTGVEVGCSIMGRKRLTIGEVDCIALHDHAFLDFHEKYTLESSEILCPAPFDEKTIAAIKTTALKLYKLFQCKDFARVDMFILNDGTILFNEINTIPGLTSHSRFPAMMKHAGFSFNKLIQNILMEAINEENTVLS